PDLNHISPTEIFDPLHHTGGGTKYTDDDGTKISLGLEAAWKIAHRFLVNGSPLGKGILPSATLMVLSDGLCRNPEETREVAERIRGEEILTEHGSKIRISIKTLMLESPESSPEKARRARALLKDVAGGWRDFHSLVQDTDALLRFL